MNKNPSEELRRKLIEKNGLDQITNLDMVAISELHEFEKKEYLIRLEVPSQYLYFLVEGEVTVTHDSFDKTICVNYNQPLSWLGEAASLWRQQPNCNVQALTPCTCVAIDLWKYREALINDLLFLQNTCQLLSLRLNDSTKALTDLLEPLEIRLAKFILRYASEDVFALQLTNCAFILNASYRHLLRIMKEFCRKGFLHKQKNIYLIKNRSALEAYAAGNIPAKLD
ncbi:MAG: cyclic nucleotide-binding domain-containing protein [Peptococcaceae bacterium]|nr:cyclic nucleotide-binding domain-containing protein [Peptococcaceae bacterium]